MRKYHLLGMSPLAMLIIVPVVVALMMIIGMILVFVEIYRAYDRLPAR